MEIFVQHLSNISNIQHTFSNENAFEEPMNLINNECLDNPVTVEELVKTLSLLKKRNTC